MKATMAAIVPRFVRIFEVMIEAQIIYAALPQTAEAMAALEKILYDSLVKDDFIAEQGWQIIIAPAGWAPGQP